MDEISFSILLDFWNVIPLKNVFFDVKQQNAVRTTRPAQTLEE